MCPWHHACVPFPLTCPDHQAFALGAVAGASLGGDQQHVHLSAGQLADVTAGVVGGAAGGLSVRALQRGSVHDRTLAGGPAHAHRAVLAARQGQHVLGRTGSCGEGGGKGRETHSVTEHFRAVVLRLLHSELFP